ncbi:MAG: class I adenylate-forming enzyme family protein [Corynebacterium sp.]|uniref:class I adenylate-forming enzyme family protein n=1 Tax=Corynebacterium sp. TaxID=1720 RepID=UPI003F053234
MVSDRITVVGRRHNPYADHGIVCDDAGVRRWAELPESLVAMLGTSVQRGPDEEAVSEVGGDSATYRELWEAAQRVAGGLKEGGLQRGDRVAVRYHAGVNWVTAFWGVIMAGGVVVAVNTRSTPAETAFVLEDSGTTVDLVDGMPLPVGDPYLEEGLGLDDIAALFYTSGTTGDPKGVPTSHEAFLSNVANCLRNLDFGLMAPGELRTLISVPLFHVTGCNTQLLTALWMGGTARIMPAFDQDVFIDSLRDDHINFIVTVPAIYALLVRHDRFAEVDTATLRWVTYGGAPIAPSLVKTLQEAFPQAEVGNGYGMTETSSVLTMLPHADGVEHADSVGYAAPSVELGVDPIDPDDPLVGELVARGANVATWYWRRPEETVETVIDGWLHTGDIVRVDEAGRVYIIDRAKDIINRGGENISSIEVESALTALQEVVDAAVIAVPDDVMGEKVGAILYTDGVDIDQASVIDRVSRSLSDFKVPQYLIVVDEPLPRNPGGKLLKGKLRDEARWGPPLR